MRSACAASMEAAAPCCEASSAKVATSISVKPEPRASCSMALRYRFRVAKSIAAKALRRRRHSSTRLTLSNSSAQSMSEISRMLVMTLRTVTLDAPCRWCACSTTSPTDVPCSCSRSSSQPSAGVVRGSWSLSRLASCAAKSSDKRTLLARGDVGFERGMGVAGDEQPVGQRLGVGTRPPAVRDLVGQAAQVLDEDNAQRDRHRPQFTDRERLHALVGGDEAPQRRGIEVAVGVGHERPGQAEHARITGERAAGELRQLPVVARRQVVADLADLLFDQVVVVQQPFSGGHDTAAAFQLRRAGAIGGQQDSRVGIEAALQRQDGSRPWP